MDWGLISGLRKLLTYVRGLLPEGARKDARPGPVQRLHARLEESPRYVRARDFVKGTGVYQAAALLVRCFVWKDLRGEQVELASLPADVRPLQSQVDQAGEVRDGQPATPRSIALRRRHPRLHGADGPKCLERRRGDADRHADSGDKPIIFSRSGLRRVSNSGGEERKEYPEAI